MSTWSFPGVKRQGRGSDHPHSPSAEVKERVDLYIHSPSGSSWTVLRWTLPLPLYVKKIRVNRYISSCMNITSFIDVLLLSFSIVTLNAKICHIHRYLPLILPQEFERILCYNKSVVCVVLFVIRIVLLLIVLFYVLFVCKCVLCHCHRVSTQL
jgi:hypothetical protein